MSANWKTYQHSHELRHSMVRPYFENKGERLLVLHAVVWGNNSQLLLKMPACHALLKCSLHMRASCLVLDDITEQLGVHSMLLRAARHSTLALLAVRIVFAPARLLRCHNSVYKLEECGNESDRSLLLASPLRTDKVGTHGQEEVVGSP